MTVVDKLSLGLNTMLIGMGIVLIVLIVLWGIVVLEHKIFEASGLGRAKNPLPAGAPPLMEETVNKTGRAEGVSRFVGVDDETAAVIIAAVCEDSNIPMDEIRIISIRKMDE